MDSFFLLLEADSFLVQESFFLRRAQLGSFQRCSSRPGYGLGYRSDIPGFPVVGMTGSLPSRPCAGGAGLVVLALLGWRWVVTLTRLPSWSIWTMECRA